NPDTNPDLGKASCSGPNCVATYEDRVSYTCDGKVITRTWTCSDGELFSTCVQHLYFNKDAGPKITCPDTQTVECGGSTDPDPLKPPTVTTGPCSGGCVTVDIYSGTEQAGGFTDDPPTTGGGAPYTGLVGSLKVAGVSFATDTGYAWHPFGLD